MAKFQKGEGGRPKGAKNKSTKLGQAKIASFLDNGGYDDLMQEIARLEGKDKVHAYIKLIEFVVPKQKAVEHKGDNAIGTITVNFDSSNTMPPITSENDLFDDD
jgi:alanine-alpha-ketoisovalerate/valine-pyruvate aminotransferase